MQKSILPLFEPNLRRHDRVTPPRYVHSPCRKLIQAIGRVTDLGIEVVLVRYCDGPDARRHKTYWTPPVDGLFRLTPLGIEWYGEVVDEVPEYDILSAVQSEVAKYREDAA